MKNPLVDLFPVLNKVFQYSTFLRDSVSSKTYDKSERKFSIVDCIPLEKY